MSNKIKLLENDIKALVLNHLSQKTIINEDSLIMSELTIGNYSRRVDLAVLTNNKLIAFEIKSEADSLYRLNGQVETYLKYFDKVIVISDTKFFPKITNELPKNVGLWEIKNNEVKVRNRGRYNTKIENESLIDFIDVAELKKLSSKLNIVADKKRSSLEKALQKTPNKLLRMTAIETLERKFKKNSQIFKNKTKNKLASINDLNLLSRFYDQREKHKEELETNLNFWSNFEKRVNELEKFANSIS
ncbi:sce7726 family protein [Halobacteriovorax sp. HFRX-2_2]|uniref:sce7726 family protein n=1 Tax=unclassified Halobacteriovorax TaxID=2639665 RepID=UPI00371287D3